MIFAWNSLDTTMWNKNLRGWKIESKNSLADFIMLITLPNIPDKLISSSNNNTWSTRDMYKLVEQGGPKDNFWNIIWRVKVPPRVKIIMWKLGRCKLPVRGFLHNREVGTENECPICFKVVESTHHIFWEYTIAKPIWNL